MRSASDESRMSAANSNDEGCRRRLRFNPLLAPIRKRTPTTRDGIASPDQTQLRSGCPVFHLGLGCLALYCESPAAAAARSYSGTEDVHLRRWFSREIDSGPSVEWKEDSLPDVLHLCQTPREGNLISADLPRRGCNPIVNRRYALRWAAVSRTPTLLQVAGPS